MKSKLFARLSCVIFAIAMVMVASSDDGSGGTGTGNAATCTSDATACTDTAHANGYGCSTVLVNNQPACCSYIQWLCSGTSVLWTERWIDGDSCLNLGSGYECYGTAPTGSGGDSGGS